MSLKIILALIISIIANIAQLAIMFKIIFWKRQQKINDYNNRIVKREEVEHYIKEKYKNKKEKLNEDIKKAQNFSDYIDIFSNN